MHHNAQNRVLHVKYLRGSPGSAPRPPGREKRVERDWREEVKKGRERREQVARREGKRGPDGREGGRGKG